MAPADKIKKLVSIIRYNIKKKYPESLLLSAIYASNIVLILFHLVYPSVSEKNLLVSVIDFIVAVQLFLPVILMPFTPVLHYLVMLGIASFGLFHEQVAEFPVYYYTVIVVLVFATLKLEPILSTSPVIVKIEAKIKRNLKYTGLPKTREEWEFTLKTGWVYLLLTVLSAVIYAYRPGYPTLFALVYSLLAAVAYLYGLGAERISLTGKIRKSKSLILVMKYPILYSIAVKMKPRVSMLAERAGELIYELGFIAKFLIASIWVLLVSPAVTLMVYAILGGVYALITGMTLIAVSVMLYYGPIITLNAKISARKKEVDQRYHLFLAYAYTLMSAGYSLYQVFKELLNERGKELFPRFHKEAKYFVSLIEKQGLSDKVAINRFAASHPSSIFRQFLLGYIHQVELSGNVEPYLESKLNEALSDLKNKLQTYVENLETIMNVALMVLILPLIVVVLSFILMPDMIMTTITAMAVFVIPLVGVLVYIAGTSFQVEYRNEYKLSFIPSIIGAIIGAVVGVYIGRYDKIAGLATALAGASLGYYIEFYRKKREYGAIESSLPQIFRDLTELRSIMPVSQAIVEMSKMNYPEAVRKLFARMATLRAQGVKISQQGWHSRAWAWKFLQFLLGKIEDTGGGTPGLFRQLMLFFTEMNNLIKATKYKLGVSELLIYISPILLGFTMYTTISMFAPVSKLAPQGILQNQQLVSSTVLNTIRFFSQGIPQGIITITEAIILEVAIVLGFIGGKLKSGTVKDTRILSISLIIVVLTLLLLPHISFGIS